MGREHPKQQLNPLCHKAQPHCNNFHFEQHEKTLTEKGFDLTYFLKESYKLLCGKQDSRCYETSLVSNANIQANDDQLGEMMAVKCE